MGAAPRHNCGDRQHGLDLTATGAVPHRRIDRRKSRPRTTESLRSMPCPASFGRRSLPSSSLRVSMARSRLQAQANQYGIDPVNNTRWILIFGAAVTLVTCTSCTSTKPSEHRLDIPIQLRRCPGTSQRRLYSIHHDREHLSQLRARQSSRAVGRDDRWRRSRPQRLNYAYPQVINSRI